MTYIAIADRDEVRRLSGNRAKGTVPDAVIDSAIVSADDYARDRTRNQNWNVGDAGYNSVKMGSERIAASTIRHMFQDEQDEAEELFKEGNGILDTVAQNGVIGGGSGSGTSAGTVVSRVRPYQTYPLNQDVGYDAQTTSGGSIF